MFQVTILSPTGPCCVPALYKRNYIIRTSYPTRSQDTNMTSVLYRDRMAGTNTSALFMGSVRVTFYCKIAFMTHDPSH